MAIVLQNCGDVLTKKKLDPHRAQCYGASFTCLDCMTHFRGTDYKLHTVRSTFDTPESIVVDGVSHNRTTKSYVTGLLLWESIVWLFTPVLILLRTSPASLKHKSIRGHYTRRNPTRPRKLSRSPTPSHVHRARHMSKMLLTKTSMIALFLSRRLPPLPLLLPPILQTQ